MKRFELFRGVQVRMLDHPEVHERARGLRIRVKFKHQNGYWVGKVLDRDSEIYLRDVFLTRKHCTVLIPSGMRPIPETLADVLRQCHVDPKEVLGDDGGGR